MIFAVKREMAEQQLRARQMVLQQQATSAVAAASKTQREVGPNLLLWLSLLACRALCLSAAISRGSELPPPPLSQTPPPLVLEQLAKFSVSAASKI